jgi:hypothetical protein
MTTSQLKNLNKKELLSLFSELHSNIYDAECFGSRDLALLEKVEEEADRRGIELPLSEEEDY